MNKEFTFKVLGEGKAIIKLNEHSLTISRPGIMPKFTHGFVGEKTIMLNQITAVQIKKSSMWVTGFIQFVVPGSIEVKKSKPLERVMDENIVYFKDSWGKFDQENKNAEFIKNYIEQYNNQQARNQTANVINSNLDEIKKLKELLDINAITQEEFDSKKAQLLDLK